MKRKPGPTPPPSDLPADPGAQKRMGIMAGVPSRDYQLMSNIQGRPPRRPDASVDPDASSPGRSGGAFASPDGGDPAFPDDSPAAGDGT